MNPRIKACQLGVRSLPHLSPVDVQDALVFLGRGTVLGNDVQVEGAGGSEDGQCGGRLTKRRRHLEEEICELWWSCDNCRYM